MWLFLSRVTQLEFLKQPGYLFQNDDAVAESELLVCFDPFKAACAAGVHLRNIYKDGTITSSLLKAATLELSRRYWFLANSSSHNNKKP